MRKLVISMAAILGLVSLSPIVFGQMGMMGPGGMMMGMSMVRHHYVMMNGIEPRYASKENPLQPTAQNIESGKKLFEQNCARCHGMTGLGDGRDGESLSPRPANIAAASKMPMTTDGYLFWAISEGGAPVGSAMPPFKDGLKEDEIWKIITYLRVL